MADANVEPPVDTSDGIKSGTRLKVRWADFDGIKSFVSLFDTTRNEACMPRKFSDGKTYCTPPTANVVFRDANCTMPIGQQSRSCFATQATHFVENDPLTCENLPKKIYSRGASISQPMYYQVIAGACRSIVASNSDLYLLGAEVPLTELAALEEEPVSITPGRMQQRFFKSADGARIFSSLYDTELEVDAFLAQDASRGGATGIPTANTIPSNLFGNASCTQPRISSVKGCPAPKYARRTTLSCAFGGSTVDIFKVNTQADPASLYFVDSQSGSCSVSQPSINNNYYEIGSQALGLGVFTRSPTTEGQGRFRKIYYSDGTSKILDPSLFDTTRQTECAPTVLADGTIRCLPINTYSTEKFYTNATCTEEIAVAIVPNSASSGCTLPPLPKYSTFIAPVSCAREVRTLNQPIAATLYRLNSNVCTALALSGSTAYSLGDVSLDDFAVATATDE